MKAREDRGDRLWIALAISSFPVPVSPRINTVESVAATLSTAFRTFRRDWEEPTISSNIREWSNSSRRAMFSFRVRSSFRFRSSISVPVAYQRTMRPCPSRNGLYWMKNHRYCPSFPRARCSSSKGTPFARADCRYSASRWISSGWKMRSRKSGFTTSSIASPV